MPTNVTVRNEPDVAGAGEVVTAGGNPGAARELTTREQAVTWLRNLYTGLVNLEIKTTVSKGPEQIIKTKINLVDGDIETEIHENFVQGLNVYEFHKEQVSKGEAVIERNVRTVKTLAEGLLDLFAG